MEPRSTRKDRPPRRPSHGSRPNRGGFARCRGGNATVEFALLGGLAIYFVVEALQAGLYFYTSAALDRATMKAARQIMTGAVSSAGLTADNFRNQILCPNLPASMACSNVVTNIQNVPQGIKPAGFYNYVNASQSGIIMPSMDNSATKYCIGTTGSYIYMQVFYAMPALSPAWVAAASTTWNGKTVHFVGAYAAFKNEPFQAGSQAGC